MAFSPPCQWVCSSPAWNGWWENGEQTIQATFHCGGLTTWTPCSGDYFLLQLYTTTYDTTCHSYDTNEACCMIYVANTACASANKTIECSISGVGMGLSSGRPAYVEISSHLYLGGECGGLKGTLMCDETNWFWWDGVNSLSPINPPCG